MPGTLGVSFLIELHDRVSTKDAKKVLLTGQAGLQDTINAVNQAEFDYYFGKPWDVDELHLTIKKLLTDFVISNDGTPRISLHCLIKKNFQSHS